MSIDITQCRRSAGRALIPALALLMLLGAGCSEKETTSSQQAVPAQAPAQQIAEPPAADKPTDAQPASANGEMIFQAYCKACHVIGVAGAPKLGDKEAWAPRIEKGSDALHSSVKNGLNAMPPQGGCTRCSDDQLRLAIEYMVEQGS